MTAAPSTFQRLLLPGFAFKAVVIGGGYATGRELVEFFFDGGPLSGLIGLLVTMVIWSCVCVLTFVLAWVTRSYDYKAFFKTLLGPFWIVFEAAYVALILLVLSVFAASAGEICRSLFGWPLIAGTAILMAGIATVSAYGNTAVELLFKYVTVFLYAVYAVFFVLMMTEFGDRSIASLAMPVHGSAWLSGGIKYAGYNLIGAVVILPVLRHLVTRRDAVVAGLLCGPLAAAPAILFFLCLIAFYPAVGDVPIPSGFLLDRLDLPVFQIVFQLMVLSALLESGTGLVHALSERVTAAYTPESRQASQALRFAVALTVVVSATFIAERIGLIALIAKGYSASAYVFLSIYVAPLLTIGIVKAWRQRRGDAITDCR